MVEDEIIRIALNSQLSEKLENELLLFECRNFVKPWAALRGKNYKNVYTGFELYEQSGNGRLHTDSIAPCAIGYFFDALSVFIDSECNFVIPENDHMFYINADITDYFGDLKGVAKEIAERWNDKKNISISQIYILFDRWISCPLDEAHDKRRVYNEFKKLGS